MTTTGRWLLAIGLVVIDLAIFVVPVTGLVAGYVVVARPPWFRDWIDQLYGGG